MAVWATPLREILGGKTAAALERHLRLGAVGQLLRHYPRRYEERGGLTDLSDLVVGEEVTVLAEVRAVRSRPMRNRSGRLLEVTVGDGRSTVTLTFFNQPWRERELYPGRRGLFAGKVGEFHRSRQLNKPDYLLLDAAGADDPAGEPADDPVAAAEFVGAVMPVYRSAAELPSWVISRSIRLVLDQLDPLEDPVPPAVLEREGLVDRDTAIRHIHRPPDRGALAAARTRLAWDEAFATQLTLARRRRAALADPATPRPPRGDGVRAAFDAALPFTLTDGQREVGAQIDAELARPHPMHRLLQGEVGSGKTLVALRAMLQVVDGGGQAALLAPTEVLAAQHARSVAAMLGPLGRAGEIDGAPVATRAVLLTGSMPAAAQRRALEQVASGAAGLVVGTHALIQDRVDFADLGLVVVDEQHRFGVEQRDALRAKSRRPPHLLVMTATPIPRTVAMTVFGDLDTSVLRELPRGRSPIATSVVPAREKPAWLERAWQRIREEVAAGRQGYVVCPRIGDDAGEATGTDDGEATGTGGGDGGEGAGGGEGAEGDGRRAPLAVTEVTPMLAEGALAGLRVAALHGRLPADAKEQVMARFAAGEIDVLVATTVVEVGVDVPNATVMVVLDAERFGVSQLHQLRGRVGRGQAPGLCLLVTEATAGGLARGRLDAVAATLDGFELARLDLEQRREGDVLGAAQSGRSSQLRLLSLLRDEALIGSARVAATQLVAADPELRDHPALAAEVAAALDPEQARYLEKS